MPMYSAIRAAYPPPLPTANSGSTIIPSMSALVRPASWIARYAASASRLIASLPGRVRSGFSSPIPTIAAAPRRLSSIGLASPGEDGGNL